MEFIMARSRTKRSRKSTQLTATRSAAVNRNLVKQILGRWRTQRKAPITLPSLPDLSIDRVPSRKTPILLNQQTGRKVNNRQTQPDKQSVDKIARREKVCKQRPDSKKAQKGTGGSKEFVPWCK
jgi:hypothetical protein